MIYVVPVLIGYWLVLAMRWRARSTASGRHEEIAECRATIAELCTYRNGGTMSITGGFGSGRTEVIKSLEKTAREANMKFIGSVTSPPNTFFSGGIGLGPALRGLGLW